MATSGTSSCLLTSVTTSTSESGPRPRSLLSRSALTRVCDPHTAHKAVDECGDESPCCLLTSATVSTAAPRPVSLLLLSLFQRQQHLDRLGHLVRECLEGVEHGVDVLDKCSDAACLDGDSGATRLFTFGFEIPGAVRLVMVGLELGVGGAARAPWGMWGAHWGFSGC